MNHPIKRFPSLLDLREPGLNINIKLHGGTSGRREAGRGGGGLTVELHHGAQNPLQFFADVDHGERAVVRVHDAHIQVA